MEIDRTSGSRVTNDRRTEARTLERWVRGWPWLDGLGNGTQKVVGAIYDALGTPGRVLRNAMHGTSITHHPLHPALSDVPLGAWTVGFVADWLFVITGRVPAVAGDIALVVGILGALFAAVAGLTDHHDTVGFEERMATLHGSTMVAVTAAMIVSLVWRIAAPAPHPGAIALSTLGWLGVLAGAYVGGHLSFGMGTAVNHNAFYEGPADFVQVGSAQDFPEGQMRRVLAGDLPVVIVRRAGSLRAIGAVCAHAGGPLDEGELDGDVVTCPWHASRFKFSDGRVVKGPSAFDQPLLSVRERAGIVEVKLARPLR